VVIGAGWKIYFHECTSFSLSSGHLSPFSLWRYLDTCEGLLFFWTSNNILFRLCFVHSLSRDLMRNFTLMTIFH